jgi:dTDP-4-dehydrorhamnose reductase
VPNVLVLGAGGMLGTAVARHLSERPNFAVRGTFRDRSMLPRLRRCLPGIDWRPFDALAPKSAEALSELAVGQAWMVNAIGVIKQRLGDKEPDEVATAMRVDTELPRALDDVASKRRALVLQIATDCVFSGTSGGYTESSRHDAQDAYGRTKSIGEIASSRIRHLRCSIVGLELRPPVSLLGWFLSQSRGARVQGFTNHPWNGLTTFHFARIVAAIIENNVDLDHLQHLVPGDAATKRDLLGLFARAFARTDIAIEPFETPVSVDRRLATDRPDLNARLWRLAGYTSPPSIEQMLREYSQWAGSGAPDATA